LWGGLLDVLTYNLNRKQERAMLFEMGSSYHASSNDTKTSYIEVACLSALFYAASSPEQWASATKEVDFYDVKAHVDALTKHQATYKAETHVALHPGQSARVYLHGKAIGWLGKLHPKWQQHYSLAKSTILFELETAPLLANKVASYQEVSKFLPVRRDIAVVVDADLPAQNIINAVNKANIPLLQEIQLFDVYQGKGIAENKKSLAFLVLMQDTHKTLLDIEAEAAMAELLKLLESEFGASLRN
jgi:phenylalanyl-tRNA synthetase beta chain